MLFCDYIVVLYFFFKDTATTEIYTYYTLFPYTTLFRSRQFVQAVGRPEAVAEGGEARAVGSQQGHVGPPRHLLDLAEFRQIVGVPGRSEEHTSELQSLMRISYAVFCLKKKKTQQINNT